MKIGTKSVLFGVHQFLWHPVTVAFAWKRVHGRWPQWWQCICIAVHDWGYWGCDEMDGPEGKMHPVRGARIAEKIVGWFDGGYNLYPLMAYWTTLYHSSSMAKAHKCEPSSLYLPDKVSILFDPIWFYLFRARLSGESKEYISNSPFEDVYWVSGVDKVWFKWYRLKVRKKLEEHEKNTCLVSA